MPHHVAVFMNSLMLGGAERVILALTRALAARRTVRVDLLLTAREGPLVAEIPDGIRVIELGMAGAPAVWASLLRLPWPTLRCVGPPFLLDKTPKAVRCLPRLVRFLRAERPDGLLTTLSYNNLVALWASALAGMDTRVVVREANTLSQEASASATTLGRRMPALAGLWYPRAAGVVAVSEGVATDLARVACLPPERITTIHNPVDMARIAALAEAPVAPPLDPRWFEPGQPPVVVAVGRLAPQKDYPTLLRAFARVVASRPARLLILGEGPERPALHALASSLGITAAVELPGAVENPFAAVRRAAVFVLSSAWEGFPNVLAEALACGCPVVSTDCPSGPAELLEGGSLGRLVPVGDDEGLAQAISATLDAPQHSDRLLARARGLSLDAALDRYLSLLLPSAA